MISNPKHGWSNFDLKAFHGIPSYLTDVSVDLLNAFIQYHTAGTGIAWFDEDGTEFTLVITPEATKEENEAINKYLESISKPTGYNIYEDSIIIGKLNRFIDGIDEAIDSVYVNPTAEHDKLIYNNAYAFALEKCKACIQNIIEGREFNDSGESQ